jgi:hypothetical protein
MQSLFKGEEGQRNGRGGMENLCVEKDVLKKNDLAKGWVKAKIQVATEENY